MEQSSKTQTQILKYEGTASGIHKILIQSSLHRKSETAEGNRDESSELRFIQNERSQNEMVMWSETGFLAISASLKQSEND